MQKPFRPERYVGPKASLWTRKRVLATLETMRRSVEAGFLINVAGTPPEELLRCNSVEEFKKQIEEYFPGWFKLMRLLEEAEKEEFSKDMEEKWEIPVMKKEEIPSKSFIRAERGEKILRLKDVLNWCLGGMVGAAVHMVLLDKSTEQVESFSLREYQWEVKKILEEAVRKHRKGK